MPYLKPNKEKLIKSYWEKKTMHNNTESQKVLQKLNAYSLPEC